MKSFLCFLWLIVGYGLSLPVYRDYVLMVPWQRHLLIGVVALALGTVVVVLGGMEKRDGFKIGQAAGRREVIETLGSLSRSLKKSGLQPHVNLVWVLDEDRNHELFGFAAEENHWSYYALISGAVCLVHVDAKTCNVTVTEMYREDCRPLRPTYPHSTLDV